MIQQRLKGLVVAHMTARRMRGASPLPASLQAETVSALRTIAGLPETAREAELMGFTVAFQNPAVLQFPFHEIPRTSPCCSATSKATG